MLQETANLSDRPVARLFDGPLDLIGDVHGEAEALRRCSGTSAMPPTVATPTVVARFS